MTTETQPSSSRRKMGAALLVGLSVTARVGCALFGVLAFVGFGIFGSLSPGMLAGFLALAAAVIPASRAGSTDRRSTLIITLAALGMVCQIADVIAYYWLHNIPGNYYAWPETIAFFGALASIAVVGVVTRREQQHVV